MDTQLSGKVALVTGSTTGLGASIARMLASEGAAVVVHGRNEAKAGAVTSAIADLGGSSAYVLGDLRSDPATADAFRQAEERFGQGSPATPSHRA